MRDLVGILTSVLVLVACGKGSEDWSGIKPHPAVVNPVCGSPAGTVLDLGGEWAFATLPYNADRSQFFRKMQYAKTWTEERTIRVPGSWESQGVGDAVPAPRRSCYGGRVSNFPLTHSFCGDGWYRRTVDVPADWAGKRIWLKVGGVGCQGWFWVNDVPVAHVFDYCATRKFEVTDFVDPGRPAKIVVEVSNAAPSKLGTREDVSCWGGILRPLELEATPDVFIDDAWVRGDFDKRLAEAHVEVAGKREEGRGKRLRVTVEGETVEAALDNQTIRQSGNRTILKIALRNFRPWSPEHPNLYTAKVELVESGRVVQTRTERFGVRKLEVRGKDFYLNDRPFFIRGCGFHEIDPINGRHLPDRDYCRARIAKVRAAGFNFARLHTRCESPEFFDAADELGLMLQPELPYYGDHAEAMAPFEPLADAVELWENFRRHPSFAVYCGGNEGTFGPVLGPKFYAAVKAMDPDRLVIEQDTMAQPAWKRTPCAAYEGAETWRGRAVTAPDDLTNYRVAGYDDFVSYPSKIWPRGKYDPPCPLVAHEYLNLSVKSDTRLEPDYTGLWDRPVRRSVRGEWLARFGLDHGMGDRLQDAQHALQALWQKKGIESARKDPFCDGYHFWSVTDCTFANEIGWTGRIDEENPAYMAQGLFNAFFGERIGGQTAAGFARFNSPVGIFVDAMPTNLQLQAGSAFSFEVFLANYGEAALPAAPVEWRIVDSHGETRARGLRSAGDQPLGGVRKIAAVEAPAPDVAVPTAAKLVVSFGGHSNEWDCWLFPKRGRRDGRDLAVFGAMRAAVAAAYADVLPPERASEAKVVVADFGSKEALAALARGQGVIEVGGQDGPENTQLGWWFLSGIVGAVFETEHPILAGLPESKVLSTLHFRIFKKGLRLPLPDFGAGSLVAVSEEGSSCRAHLAARVDANGGRHLLAYGLAIDRDLPEAVAILDGLVDFARRPVSASERIGTRAARGVRAEEDGVRTRKEKDMTETGGDGRL